MASKKVIEKKIEEYKSRKNSAWGIILLGWGLTFMFGLFILPLFITIPIIFYGHRRKNEAQRMVDELELKL